MEEVEDCDIGMECEQIDNEEVVCQTKPHQEDLMEGRAAISTSNDISGIFATEEEPRPVTPPNEVETQPATPPNVPRINNNLFRTPGGIDSFFIKRGSIDSLKSRPRMTSTPLQERGRLCHTLPPSLAAPNLAHLRNMRACRSAGNVIPPKAPSGIPLAHLNPFTPEGKLLRSKLKAHKKFKRLSLGPSPPPFVLDSSDSERTSTQPPQKVVCLGMDIDLDDLPRKPKLCECEVTRYEQEFFEIEEIGKGDYGCVYKCLNLVNGVVYAVKKTLKPLRTGIQERMVRNEVYAHGVLRHKNIVQNFSCWVENEKVYIQNEYCNGGNLESYIKTHTMTEPMLKNLLFQIACGLECMHKIGLVHMDVKPGNIFLCFQNKDNSIGSECGSSSSDEKDEIIFKLGDLGHVSKLGEDDAEEGDCRYLAREVIEETYKHLDRADMFALGLTVYEAAGGGSLPLNGDEWHVIRNGNIKYLDAHSIEFNQLLKSLIDPVPENRPTASYIVNLLKPPPVPVATPEEITSYVSQYRRNSDFLEQTALATNQFLKLLFQAKPQVKTQVNKDKPGTPSKDKSPSIKKGGVTKTRVIGRKTNRSSSTTLF